MEGLCPLHPRKGILPLTLLQPHFMRLGETVYDLVLNKVEVMEFIQKV